MELISSDGFYVNIVNYRYVVSIFPEQRKNVFLFFILLIMMIIWFVH